MRISGLLLLLLAIYSCKKSDTKPPTNQQVNSNDTTFANDAAAINVATNVYNSMTDPQNFTSGSAASLTVLCGLYDLELDNYSSFADQAAFRNGPLTADNSLLENSIWKPAYQFIDSANKLIKKLSVSNNVSAAVKQQLLGEAKFIRAFCHFYLVNLFGGIPYITTTDSATIYSSHRLPVTEVYQQIISDLLAAQDSLSPFFLDETRTVYTTERVGLTKWAATAMLARAYLYISDYTDAEIQSTQLIDQTSLFALTDPNNTFLKNSSEAIWQLKPTAAGINTYEGNLFILNSVPTNVDLSVLIGDGYAGGDLRGTDWISQYRSTAGTWYYPFKYKIKSSSIITEYYMVLRLAEQYLIRAEARVQLGKLDLAQADLNVIRGRAGLSNTTAQTSDDLLRAVSGERYCELFAEWGHHWFDQKRLQRPTLVVLKANWSDNDTIFPIPSAALHSNPNLQQNPGY